MNPEQKEAVRKALFDLRSKGGTNTANSMTAEQLAERGRKGGLAKAKKWREANL